MLGFNCLGAHIWLVFDLEIWRPSFTIRLVHMPIDYFGYFWHLDRWNLSPVWGWRQWCVSRWHLSPTGRRWRNKPVIFRFELYRKNMQIQFKSIHIFLIGLYIEFFQNQTNSCVSLTSKLCIVSTNHNYL